jgi:cytochrome b subunit of formate dehydrogenase
MSVDDVTVESVNGADHAASESNQRGTARQAGLLAGGSLSLALIEALCVLFLGVSKFGILIGLASFMSAEIASPFHADRIRVPLLGAALIGAVANLFLLWNAQRLRNASAAAWRKRPLTASQRRRIVFVIAISVVTILLVVGEFWIHPIGVR